MAIQATPLTGPARAPQSWFLVQPGQPCDLTLEIADQRSGNCVDWSGHVPRFRVYSQYVDRCVLVEITDPARCCFEPGGIWKLHLTADETAALPRGGMVYTLEHRHVDGDQQLGRTTGAIGRTTGNNWGHPSPCSLLTAGFNYRPFRKMSGFGASHRPFFLARHPRAAINQHPFC